MALRAGDVAVAYDDRGSGDPALLCLPGWCANRSAFEELAAATASRYRTLAMDWRGHGDSAAPGGDFGTSELVEDALAVIAASGAEAIVPVATAHAGWVAIELLRRLGERIPKVVLVDWIVTEAPPPFLAGLRAMTDPAQAFAVRRSTVPSRTGTGTSQAMVMSGAAVTLTPGRIKVNSRRRPNGRSERPKGPGRDMRQLSRGGRPPRRPRARSSCS